MSYRIPITPSSFGVIRHSSCAYSEYSCTLNVAWGVTESARTFRLNRDGRNASKSPRELNSNPPDPLSQNTFSIDVNVLLVPSLIEWSPSATVTLSTSWSLLSSRKLRNEMKAPPYSTVSFASSRTRSSGLRLFPMRGRSSVAYCTRKTLKMLGVITLVSSPTSEFARSLNDSACERPAGNAKLPASSRFLWSEKLLRTDRRCRSLSVQSRRPKTVSTSLEISHSPYCEAAPLTPYCDSSTSKNRSRL